MARDVTNRGGAFTRTTGTSKSPSEAVFILLEVLLKPGSPYSFGGTPKARQPLMLLCLLSPVCLLLTCLQVELLRMRTGNGQTLTVPRQKYFLAHSPKSFLTHPYVTREPVMSPTEGGSAFTRTTITSKSPGEAVFIREDEFDSAEDVASRILHFYTHSNNRQAKITKFSRIFIVNVCI